MTLIQSLGMASESYAQGQSDFAEVLIEAFAKLAKANGSATTWEQAAEMVQAASKIAKAQA